MVLKHVADLTGQIRGMRSRICQDVWVADLAGCVADFCFVVRLLAEGCRYWRRGIISAGGGLI